MFSLFPLILSLVEIQAYLHDKSVMYLVCSQYVVCYLQLSSLIKLEIIWLPRSLSGLYVLDMLGCYSFDSHITIPILYLHFFACWFNEWMLVNW